MMEKKGDYRVKPPPKSPGKDDKNTPFPRRMWAMIESVEHRHPDILRWEKGGKAFYIDKDHPKLNKVLREELQCTSSFISFLFVAKDDRPPRHRHPIELRFLTFFLLNFGRFVSLSN